MTITTGTIGIIADDLTGANDTALQFHLSGCNTQILFDYNEIPRGIANTHAWALSTETRHADPQTAYQTVHQAAKVIVENLKVEHVYKKLDSTLRGNIAQEALAIINALEWDAAVIVPAFPTEGRITVGGYHLLKGIPIERTEFARDPKAPISQSNIPALLSQQTENKDIIGHIELMTVMKGAGPILSVLNDQVKNGKKLIAIDAASTTDLEQVALAVNKASYKILPCGSAGLAQAMTKCWLPDMKSQHIQKVIPDLPCLIVSGSTTEVTRIQIKKLMESDEFEPHFIELLPEQVLTEPTGELINRVSSHLRSDKIVLVHSAPLDGDINRIIEFADKKGLSFDNITEIISDFLASLAGIIVENENLILVLIGGETAYKCCNAINSKQLQLIDEVDKAIPLCLDHKAQWIVTKSGNLGSPNTLIEILRYFKRHQEAK